MTAASGRPGHAIAMQQRPVYAAAPPPAAPLTARAPAMREMRDELPFPTRRAGSPAPLSGAPPMAAPPQRERATFVPPLDADWDTPAFQRRGH
jgi:cell division protein FtsZ